jgi:hypothetical protein
MPKNKIRKGNEYHGTSIDRISVFLQVVILYFDQTQVLFQR